MKFYPDGNIIPIINNEKKPLIAWKQYQTKILPKEELRQFNTSNYAIMCGKTSKGLLIIDFDFKDKYDFDIIFTAFKQAYPELSDTYIVSTPSGYHFYYYMKGFSVDRTLNKNIIYKTIKKKVFFSGLIKTKLAKYLKGVDFLGHKGYALIPPSRIDDSEYKPFTNCTIKEISKIEYDLISKFFLLDKPIQMRKPFRDILNGEIEIEEYATKHNKKEFVYWKFLFREAYHFCKLTPEEIFSFLKKNQDTFCITKTNHQLNYNYHSYKGRLLSNEKLKEYFPTYSFTTSCFNGDYFNNKSPDFTLYGLHSYLSKFHSKYKFANRVLNKKMLSEIHSKLVSLLLQIEEVSSHIGCCDSCATLTKIKSDSFKDPNGKLLKINECKECFESDWNMEWKSYIENRIILHQK